MAKTRFQGLICDRFKLPGARFEETRDLNIIKPKLQGVERKKVSCGRLWTAGTIFLKLRGFTINIWTKT